MTVIVDRPRAEQVLNVLVDRYRSRAYPYNTPAAVLPQEHHHLHPGLPIGGLEHANFLFCLCYYMRGVIDSVSAVKRYHRLYDRRPELFDPAQARLLDTNAVERWLLEHRLPAVAITAKTWVTNAERLYERYGGDPRRIFDGLTTYEEACARIQNDKRGGGFMGFQEKMVSMIIYFLTVEGMIEQFPHPPPVDFHAMRLVIEHEMILFPDTPLEASVYSDELLAAARELFSWYCAEHGIDPIELCSTIWIHSRSMCQYNPGNASTIDRTDYDSQRLGRKRAVDPIPVEWSPKQRANYERTCGHCVVQSTCVWNVPSGNYYIQGNLLRRGRRPLSPDQPLFLIDNLAAPKRRPARPATSALAQPETPRLF